MNELTALMNEVRQRSRENFLTSAVDSLSSRLGAQLRTGTGTTATLAHHQNGPNPKPNGNGAGA
jgi:hypothetical protein